MNNPYETLGVPVDASTEFIKRTYRAHAMKHHPDMGGDVDAFRAIQSAADLLLDSDRRDHFDRTGKTDTGSTADSAESEVLALVAEAFCQTTTDPIGYMQKAILKEREGHVLQRARINLVIQRMNDSLRKFRDRKCKDRTEAQQTIIEAVTATIDRARCDHAAADEAVQHTERKLAFLDGLADESQPLQATWPPIDREWKTILP